MLVYHIQKQKRQTFLNQECFAPGRKQPSRHVVVVCASLSPRLQSPRRRHCTKTSTYPFSLSLSFGNASKTSFYLENYYDSSEAMSAALVDSVSGSPPPPPVTFLANSVLETWTSSLTNSYT